MSNDKPPRVVVHAVHGTWQFGYMARLRHAFTGRWPDRRDVWFRDGSDFSTEIRRRVRSDITWDDSFAWSGRNSFSRRQVASAQLARHLKRQMRAEPDAKHIIVAHSHGGTIALRALGHIRSVGLPCPPLIALATPFLVLRPNDLRDDTIDDRQSAIRFPLAALMFFFLYYQRGAVVPSNINDLAHTSVLWSLVLLTILALCSALFGIVCSLLVVLSRPLSPTRDKRLQIVLGMENVLRSADTRITAIRAPLDEATLAIAVSQSSMYCAMILSVLMDNLLSYFHYPHNGRFRVFRVLVFSGLLLFLLLLYSSDIWGISAATFLSLQIALAISLALLLELLCRCSSNF